MGVAPWQSVELTAADGRILNVTGTPARHGPAGSDRGPVTGFVLASAGEGTGVVYVSGDTVWYEGVAEVLDRLRAAGKRLGIVTSKSHDTTQMAFRAVGLDAAITIWDANEGKSPPEWQIDARTTPLTAGSWRIAPMWRRI